ncbi:MAG: molybdopterin-guanine dinucleotide biosynthesis protein B [Endomicrobia bacterium]|nr:molybdopterin-guanine dinucleotide biosynthesis protein B [Endomicrobiia bacterium]MDW8055519.1 molybdopterin-guanine dinucleotide biosynthesis protein B [Elusimicrobiota bacterium]
MCAKIVAVVGNSGVGKTWLIEQLIKKLTLKKIKLAVFKHTHHKNFVIDKPGKDTYRYHTVGADNLSLFSDDKYVLIRWINKPLSLHRIVNAYFSDVDIVLVEGLKESSFNKILIVKKISEVHRVIKSIKNTLCIVVTSNSVSYRNLKVHSKPVFQIKDIKNITNFLVSKLKL